MKYIHILCSHTDMDLGYCSAILTMAVQNDSAAGDEYTVLTLVGSYNACRTMQLKGRKLVMDGGQRLAVILPGKCL